MTVSPSVYRNKLKNRLLTASALSQNFDLHSCFVHAQWSFAPGQNFERPSCQNSDSSSCFGIHWIFFDATCSLCCNAVKKIKSWDKKQLFFYAPLDSDLAFTFFEEHKKFKQIDSLILIEKVHSSKKRIWVKGRAVLRILWLIGGWRKILGIFAYLPFGVDGIYQLIARHRHRYK